ncbi:hypothetical protein PHSY_000979 [Pseudozyma hubeiensis SY62]|uniref:Uncharacterized protein n=1 Tax=Pseudozyma hubeiensis (strain SY62) TaxID=1305764 RepID=R9NXQ3_PSEHS|nr:hypothetical protein PHSY_000979 [Pseudozyma hubeiensis SY62]GAC93414.1 hypothetical protein PHSY_000979 [Pseudozyma hubeiensis SY62]
MQMRDHAPLQLSSDVWAIILNIEFRAVLYPTKYRTRACSNEGTPRAECRMTDATCCESIATALWHHMSNAMSRCTPVPRSGCPTCRWSVTSLPAMGSSCRSELLPLFHIHLYSIRLILSECDPCIEVVISLCIKSRPAKSRQRQLTRRR